MPLSFMNAIRASRGMRRKRDPGTRKPFSRPLSKQRMIVCCETLQISAASPVVNTVFMDGLTRIVQRIWTIRSLRPDSAAQMETVDSLIHLPYLTIGWRFWQLELVG